MDQLDFFNQVTHQTRRAAFKAMAPSVPRLQRAALEALDRLGEATRLEAAAEIGIAPEALQPRFSELMAQGLVEATGQRRRNPSGKSAAVLRLTDAGRAAAVDIDARDR